VSTAEVLQRGGYDVLIEPYDRQEAHRIIQKTLDSHYMSRFTQSDGAGFRVAFR
jgi:hypothetical protein